MSSITEKLIKKTKLNQNYAWYDGGCELKKEI